MTIIKLQASNFAIKGKDVFVQHSQIRNTPGLLLIWADWCPHCHAFLPQLQALSKQLGADFKCASIEHAQFSNNEKLTTALDFQAFPTIKFFDQYGRIAGMYKGTRDTSSILEYICKMYHHCILKH
jgi:thiol-disulfide isomerase/thioredoxin